MEILEGLSILCLGFGIGSLFVIWKLGYLKNPLKEKIPVVCHTSIIPGIFEPLCILYRHIIKKLSYRETDNFGKPLVVSQTKLDKILDNLEPINKENLKGEQKKEDYWWKLQKERFMSNKKTEKQIQSWHHPSENQTKERNELLGVASEFEELEFDYADVTDETDTLKTKIK